MAYSVDSKIGQILKETPQARPVILKYGVGIMLLQPATHEMNVEEVGRHLRWSPEKLNSLLAELNAV